MFVGVKQEIRVVQDRKDLPAKDQPDRRGFPALKAHLEDRGCQVRSVSHSVSLSGNKSVSLLCPPPWGALSDTVIRPSVYSSVCPMAQLPKAIGTLTACSLAMC